MSSGNFVLSKYEASFDTFIMPIRVQPETLDLTDGTTANDPPAGDVNLGLFARARKNSTEYGVGARSITVRWDTAPPTDYSGTTATIPVLTEAAFAAYTIGASVTYLSTAATVVGRSGEEER